MSATGLDAAKRTVEAYKQGRTDKLTSEVWQAKKIVDATLHPGAFVRSCCPLKSKRWR